MKKLILSLVLTLFSLSIMGCDFFGTPYDKMMNQFEKQMADSKVIEIETDVRMDFVGNPSGLQDVVTSTKMTYFTEEQSILARASAMGETYEVYFIQKGEDLLSFLIDEDMMYPIPLTDIEDLIPVDTTIFDISEYTGKAAWESDFEEIEEGVFEVEVSLATLFDDEMFEDIEESFTSLGMTLEALDDKTAILTFTYNEERGRLTMSFDIQSFVVSIYSTDYEIKIDEEISISSGSETAPDMSSYHSYPVKDIEDIIRTYQANEYFKGEFNSGDQGYYRFSLTKGTYTLVINDDRNLYDIYLYDSSLTQISKNLDGTFPVAADGTYYLEVVARSSSGYFDLKLVKIK